LRAIINDELQCLFDLRKYYAISVRKKREERRGLGCIIEV
jgi:hypothetical protein